MNETERVIKGLDICLQRFRCGEDCPYYELECEQLREDALVLLKAQKTTLEKDGHHIRCLNCGEYWCDNDREGNPFPMNFCPNCGRKVK